VPSLTFNLIKSKLKPPSSQRWWNVMLREPACLIPTTIECKLSNTPSVLYAHVVNLLSWIPPTISLTIWIILFESYEMSNRLFQWIQGSTAVKVHDATVRS